MASAPEVVRVQPGLEISQKDRVDKFVTPSPTGSFTESHQHFDNWTTKSQIKQRGLRSGLLLGILLATIAVSAILGGALGAKVSSCSVTANSTVESAAPSGRDAANSLSSTPMMATLAANYSALRPAQVDTLFNDCMNDVQPTSPLPDQYVTECGYDYGTNRKAREGGQMVDIIGIVTYSFLDCLDACAYLNQQRLQNRSSIQCRAISWSPDLRNMTIYVQSNCWLKNGTLANQDDRRPNPHIMSARIKVP